MRMTNKGEKTAFHEAVRFKHSDVVKLLIKEDPELLGKFGLVFPKLTNVSIHINSTLNRNIRQITDTK